MQKIFQKYDDIEAELATRLADPHVKIIGVEGFMLSGKTCLATELQARLKIDLLRTDRYATHSDEDTHYSRLIDLLRLKKHLDWFLEEESRVIIEGMCLREILGLIGKQPEFTVYVRKLSPVGLWHDGLNFENFEKGDYSPYRALERSAFEYHKAMRPHELAQYIFERIE